MVVKKIAYLLLDFYVMLSSVWFTENPTYSDFSISTFNRSSFPDDFIFGTASSAYQFEGAYEEDGKGTSNWDTYTHLHPETIADGANGDTAVDHYHRYREDVAIMKGLGMDAYRFSISWSRILPNGKLSGGVNKKGIQFYNDLIDELLSQGLQPSATLFHWDIPQHLEDEYGGFLSSLIVQDFQDYAEICYKEFGDRVKHWITLNEPHSYSIDGYSKGEHAPGRCSKPEGNCSAGNSGTEPYIVSHNQLLAHAAAVKVYREKYQIQQEGKIGITLNFYWMEPASSSSADENAAQRAIDFMFGWFMHPLTYGRYPQVMRTLCGDRLPSFTKRQADTVKGSYDFIGMNYYSAKYASNYDFPKKDLPSYGTDYRAKLTMEINGVPIGPIAGSDWLAVYPEGFLKVLLYTKKTYNNPTIYITENGVDEVIDNTLSLAEKLADHQRIDYHRRHLLFLFRAINEGVDVKGYFIWSLLDNFEWAIGYTVGFGIEYVDRNTLRRYPKQSSLWFKRFLLHD